MPESKFPYYKSIFVVSPWKLKKQATHHKFGNI